MRANDPSLTVLQACSQASALYLMALDWHEDYSFVVALKNQSLVQGKPLIP